MGQSNGMGRYTVEYVGVNMDERRFKCKVCAFSTTKRAGMGMHFTKRHGCMFCVDNPNSTHQHGEKLDTSRKVATYVKKVPRKKNGFGRKGLAMKRAAEDRARLGLPPIVKPKIKRTRKTYKKRKTAEDADLSQSLQANGNVASSTNVTNVLKVEEALNEEITIINQDAADIKIENRPFSNVKTEMQLNDKNIEIKYKNSNHVKVDTNNNNYDNGSFQIEDQSGNSVLIKLDTTKYVAGTIENDKTNQMLSLVMQLNHHKREYDEWKLRVEKTEEVLYQTKKDLGEALTSSELLRKQNYDLYEKYQIEVSTLIETQEQNKKLEEINQKNAKLLAKILNDRGDSILSTTNIVPNGDIPQLVSNVDYVLDNSEKIKKEKLVTQEDEANRNVRKEREIDVENVPLNSTPALKKASGTYFNNVFPEKVKPPPGSWLQAQRAYKRTQSPVSGVSSAQPETVKIDDDLLDWADQLIQ